MTRLYLDTEFNGFNGELISLALYEPASGRNFYEVVDIPAHIDPWVAENVIPKLGKSPIGEFAFRVALKAFLQRWPNPTIIADWPADYEHLFRSLVIKDHWEVDSPIVAHLIRSGEFEPEQPHNALSDARALAAWHIAATAV